MNLYPTILTESMIEAQHQLDLVKTNPQVTTVQIDVIDALFADALTISPADAEGLRFDSLMVDFHFMTEEPLDYVYECINVQDSVPIRSIIAQVEKMSYQFDYIEDVKKQGWQVGLSLDLHTPVEAIDERSWQAIDIIQLMAVEVGAQGQPLNQNVFGKIAEVTAITKSLSHSVELIIDGGIKVSNFQQLLIAGAEGLAVGSELWLAEDIDQVITQFFENE